MIAFCRNVGKTFRFQNIPADVLLDVLCLEEGLSWRIAEQRTVAIEDKP